MLSYQLQLHTRLTSQTQQTLGAPTSGSGGSGQTGAAALGVGVQRVAELVPVPAGGGSPQQQQQQQSSTPALDVAFVMLRGVPHRPVDAEPLCFLLSTWTPVVLRVVG